MSRYYRRSSGRKFSISPGFFAAFLLLLFFDTERLILFFLLASALHEVCHVGAVYLCGGAIASFRITLCGGELRIAQPERLSYEREIFCTAAGPGGNLICAVLLAQVAQITGWEHGYLQAGIHFLLALFNLLPIRVLDGGRILWLAAARVLDPNRADRILHICGMLCIGTLLVLLSGCLSALRGKTALILLLPWLIGVWCIETGVAKR